MRHYYIVSAYRQFCTGPPGHRRAVDRIFTRIGSSDDLASGRSTFMVEMTETALILNNATRHSLVLLDEIGRGTSTFDGLSLAWAVAHSIALDIGALTLFATHYFELTTLPDQLPATRNLHLSAREHGDDIIFMYAVTAGPASQSYGLQVAKLAGVPEALSRRQGTNCASWRTMKFELTMPRHRHSQTCSSPHSLRSQTKSASD